MSTSVLVAYATKYGSTQGVAEEVAAALREHRFEVDCQPVNKVQSIDKYGAIVLGAPLYIGAWPKDALSFLARQQAALAGRPIALFALGPLSAEEKEREDARGHLDKVLAKLPWLKPLAVEVFAGKLDPAQLRFPDSLLTVLPATPLHGMAAKDARDWTAIRTWAESLAVRL